MSQRKSRGKPTGQSMEPPQSIVHSTIDGINKKSGTII